MSKINSEIIISSLFRIGFDQVDSLLYTYTLGKIFQDNAELNLFEYENKELSETFNKYIDNDGNVYKFKDGYDLNTIVSLKPIQNIELPLYKVLNINSLLIEYLKEIDFKEIIFKKIVSLGIDKINDFEKLFSDKEKEIISEMFGIDKMNKERSKKQLQIYENMMKQEESSNKMLIAYLDSIIGTKNKEKIKK